MLSWLAYMKRGEPRERILGVRMPPPNLKPDFEQQARSFVDRIADQPSGAPGGRPPDGCARREPRRPLTVVITGTSTGIGAASAILLAEKGFRVFAGVRREADGEALRLGPRASSHRCASTSPMRRRSPRQSRRRETRSTTAACSVWSTTRASSSPGRWSSSRWPTSARSWRST